MKVSIIAALDNQRGLGKDNRLLWRLPNDLKWFKKNTVGKPVIMGRKTYDSIGHALPNRHNIVVTHQSHFMAPGCTVVSSLEAALALEPMASEVMVIGGGTLYQKAFPLANRLYLTQVNATLEADVFFPNFDVSEWTVLLTEAHDEDANHAFSYTFQILERKL
jgi:dihydrofolate reductase